jgi:hypothetical protein
MNYNSPLNIYVLWHPSFTEGQNYANKIYQTFNRDTEFVLARNLNIPVFYRSKSRKVDDELLPIPLQEADKNAIVLLIDENLFNTEKWHQYIKGIIPNINENTRIYPVALTPYASYFLEADNFSSFQNVRLYDNKLEDKEKEFEKRWKVLKSRLLHDITRMILDMESVADAISNKNLVPPPVKLFISHAKADGEKLANEFKVFVETNSKLNTFFDANDISDGYDFEEEINKNIDKNTAMVVFLTDAYSTREWCQIEVSTAKRKKCPIVVVHNVSKSERRSFPYLGNVPTIRWQNNFDDIIDLALTQVLTNRFAQLSLEKHIELYNLEKKYKCILLSSPPELFNYIDILKISEDNNAEPILVLYPDPPLGNEELKILNEVKDDITFITPIHTYQYL